MTVSGILVYFFCTAASASVVWLLLRAFVRCGERVLLWSSICFMFLTLTNMETLFVHVLAFSRDLSSFRLATSLAAVCVLLYGLIWEVK